MSSELLLVRGVKRQEDVFPELHRNCGEVVPAKDDQPFGLGVDLRGQACHITDYPICGGETLEQVYLCIFGLCSMPKEEAQG